MSRIIHRTTPVREPVTNHCLSYRRYNTALLLAARHGNDAWYQIQQEAKATKKEADGDSHRVLATEAVLRLFIDEIQLITRDYQSGRVQYCPLKAANLRRELTLQLIEFSNEERECRGLTRRGGRPGNRDNPNIHKFDPDLYVREPLDEHKPEGAVDVTADINTWGANDYNRLAKLADGGSIRGYQWYEPYLKGGARTAVQGDLTVDIESRTLRMRAAQRPGQSLQLERHNVYRMQLREVESRSSLRAPAHGNDRSRLSQMEHERARATGDVIDFNRAARDESYRQRAIDRLRSQSRRRPARGRGFPPPRDRSRPGRSYSDRARRDSPPRTTIGSLPCFIPAGGEDDPLIVGDSATLEYSQDSLDTLGAVGGVPSPVSKSGTLKRIAGSQEVADALSPPTKKDQPRSWADMSADDWGEQEMDTSGSVSPLPWAHRTEPCPGGRQLPPPPDDGSSLTDFRLFHRDYCGFHKMVDRDSYVPAPPLAPMSPMPPAWVRTRTVIMDPDRDLSAPLELPEGMDPKFADDQYDLYRTEPDPRQDPAAWLQWRLGAMDFGWRRYSIDEPDWSVELLSIYGTPGAAVRAARQLTASWQLPNAARRFGTDLCPAVPVCPVPPSSFELWRGLPDKPLLSSENPYRAQVLAYAYARRLQAIARASINLPTGELAVSTQAFIAAMRPFFELDRNAILGWPDDTTRCAKSSTPLHHRNDPENGLQKVIDAATSGPVQPQPTGLTEHHLRAQLDLPSETDGEYVIEDFRGIARLRHRDGRVTLATYTAAAVAITHTPTASGDAPSPGNCPAPIEKTKAVIPPFPLEAIANISISSPTSDQLLGEDAGRDTEVFDTGRITPVTPDENAMLDEVAAEEVVETVATPADTGV